MSTLDYNILKELDKHNLSGYVVNVIMSNLNTIDIKNKFLNYLINNRNIILDKTELVCFLRSELKNELY
ncbi:MAG: hypothetical protein E7172_05620 [Firmicutes bacterium]|nr:hypothetical protein [Bacillota bacterium]